MTRPTLALWALMSLTSPAAAHAQEAYPPFKEVYELLRTNLPGFSVEAFERNATEALVRQFGGRWVAAAASEPATNTAPIVQKTVYETHFPYVRLGLIGGELDQVLAGWLADTNTLPSANGIILDLRFATGNDYAVAAKTAALFAQPDQPLLDWGEGLHRAPAETNRLANLPVAILVNSRTSGAAEALAAALQEVGAGLVIGSNTAGQAGLLREFKLSNGRTLQVPVGPIRTGAGKTIASTGVTPDIAVNTRVEHELAWLNDPFTAVAASTNSASATNRIVSSFSVRRRVNEAELVRAQKAGRSPESVLGTEETNSPRHAVSGDKPSASAVQDPVLGRALDLLKGLHLIRKR